MNQPRIDEILIECKNPHSILFNPAKPLVYYDRKTGTSWRIDGYSGEKDWIAVSLEGHWSHKALIHEKHLREILEAK